MTSPTWTAVVALWLLMSILSVLRRSISRACASGVTRSLLSCAILAISHARAQGYTLIGAVRVTFNVLDSLSEGEFEVVATFEPFSVPEAPASPSLRGATNYAPVRPPRESSLPTRITKPAAQPAQPAPALHLSRLPAARLNIPVAPPCGGSPFLLGD